MFKPVYAIGDSHSGTLHPWCHAINCGAETIYTLTTGRTERIILGLTQMGQISRNALWVFCFGEIDIRCHVHNQIHVKHRDEHEVLSKLVDDYLAKIETLHDDIAVMSVVPPVYYDNRKHEVDADPASLIYQIRGSDEERSRYTEFLNLYLEEQCASNGIPYLDIYSLYKDEKGMLPIDISDGNVHILNRSKVEVFLKSIGLIP